MLTSEEGAMLMTDAWKVLTGRFPQHGHVHEDGIASLFGHVPSGFFNMSIVEHRLADSHAMRSALAIVRQRAQSCKHPWMLAVCDPFGPPGWQDVAAAEGFAIAMALTVMDTETLLPPRRPLPQLEVRRVESEAVARDLATVNERAYGLPPESLDCVAAMHLWHPDSVGYVGYDNGQPVSCAAVFPVRGTVYAALVATLPESHGKGYAEAVMRHAIEDGRRATGFTRVTLHASDMGRPLYASMGFETGGKLALLVPDSGPP